MASLLDALVCGYASLFCMSERRVSPQMSSRVHAVNGQKHLPRHKKTTKLSVNDQLRVLIGNVISENELEERLSFGRMLGTGATSKVYEAVDTKTGRRVSVKVFDKLSMVEARRSMVADGQYIPEKAVHRVRRRLLKLVSELEISKSLDHPNIVKYIGAYETSHRICIVHELVEGSDLLEYLLENGKMSESKATGVFKQLLSALEYCHNRNLFHRDLKLENVMVTKDLKVKLIDFGLSEILNSSKQPLRTVCGTPLYCSPEILFLHTSTAAARSGFLGGPADIWSVGVLIFALLTGCAPFDDSDFHRLRRDVSRNRINYPTYISDQARKLLETILVSDPELRPTISDLLSHSWFMETVDVNFNSSNKEEWKCTKQESEVNINICYRSLSCRRDSGSGGTYSSSASLDDVLKLSAPLHTAK
ncbi:camk camkl protein kinase [Plasmopara halstedii]|uniref:Camk camkl protein kinase n=1 Tax=Plasmopara halstedii TaxID=4781 RepID=A0A0P1B158_PLAHL|nr:camk camkl protein kinase [Plasmopara halstedii]CEG48140.1 camk camkl protein kinase [Plasmopara halstedii]|eukprot:XP_024584509.1 camk camkl protein kinase [Plasmopara halstedii]